jgi:hypothetical protein
MVVVLLVVNPQANVDRLAADLTVFYIALSAAGDIE